MPRMHQATQQQAAPWGRACLNLGAITLVVFVVIRWWWMIDQYSVNILFMDHWDTFTAFFEDWPLGKTYCLQLGPHRQGIGFVLTKYVNQLSGWNTRVDAAVIGAFMCAATTLAAWLKKRLFGTITWHDAAIALIVLNPLQYGIFVNTPNLSHGAMPLFLLMLLAVAWTLSPIILRWTSIAAINFFLIFSGFGIFGGPILIGMTGLEFLQGWSKRETQQCIGTGIAFVILVASLVAFFHDYRFMPAIDGFHFPVEHWWMLYPGFVIGMLANACGMPPQAGLVPIAIVGSVVGLSMMWVCAHSLWRIVLPHPAGAGMLDRRVAAIIVLFTAFTALFALNTAIGRVPVGLEGSFSSRYVPYLLPGFLGIYFYILALPRPDLRKLAITAFLSLLLLGTGRLREHDHRVIEWLHDGKKNWRDAYLETGSIEEADLRADFKIYPWPARTHLSEKLEYLKKHRLNLFHPRDAGVSSSTASGPRSEGS